MSRLILEDKHLRLNLKGEKNMRRLFIALLLLVPLAAHGAERPSPAPQAVVREFYATLKKTELQPLSQELKAVSAFLSSDLNRLIARAEEADEAYLRKYPEDKGMLGNGTCFFYGGGDCAFTTYNITKVSQAGDGVNVTVQLTLLDERPGYPSASWEDVVELKKEKERWVIDDIGYFGTKASRELKDGIDEDRKALQK